MWVNGINQLTIDIARVHPPSLHRAQRARARPSWRRQVRLSSATPGYHVGCEVIAMYQASRNRSASEHIVVTKRCGDHPMST